MTGTAPPPPLPIAESPGSAPSGAIPRATGRDRRQLLRYLTIALLALVVFGVSFWDSAGKIERTQFHPDESRWINRAYYLRELTDPFGSVWADRYLIRGQPPMGSYVTAAGLLVQGRDLDTNGPWDFRFGNESNVTWNVVHGNMPADADIMAARRWNAVIGGLTCVAIFLAIGLLTNWVGGFVAGVFLGVNPLHQYLATLGVSDAVFTAFFAFSVLAAIWLAIRPSWWRAMLLALPLAAGASTKLSPLLLSVGLAMVGVVLLLDPWLRQARATRRVWPWVSRGNPAASRRLSWMLIVQPVVVFALFVLSYPYLWSSPIGRTRTLFDFRRYEMANQARIWPHAAIDSRIEAVERSWQALNSDYSSTERIIQELGQVFGRSWTGFAFDLYLAVPGLAVLIYLAWRNGLASRHMIGLAVLGGQALLILGGLGVDFNRYYLPLGLVSAAGVGMLTGWLASLVWEPAQATWRSRRAAGEAPAEATWAPEPASARSRH